MIDKMKQLKQYIKIVISVVGAENNILLIASLIDWLIDNYM